MKHTTEAFSICLLWHWVSEPVTAIRLSLPCWDLHLSSTALQRGGTATAPQHTAIGPSSYPQRWIKHQKPFSTKSYEHHLNSCRMDSLRQRQSLAPCKVATATWKCCSEFTELPLIFFVLRLLQMKTDAVSTALCCPHTNLKNSTAKCTPDLLLVIYLTSPLGPIQLTSNADKWWKAAWQSPLLAPSAASGGSHLALWTCDSSGRVISL